MLEWHSPIQTLLLCLHQDLKLEDADVGIPVSNWEPLYVCCNCKPLCCNLVRTGIEPQRVLLTVTPSQRPSCVWTLFTLDHTASCQRYAYTAPVLGLSHSHVFSTSATDQAAKAFLPPKGCHVYMLLLSTPVSRVFTLATIELLTTLTFETHNPSTAQEVSTSSMNCKYCGWIKGIC